MTLHHEYEPNTFRPWMGEPIDDVSHMLEIEHMWSAEELAVIGLYAAAPAEEVPAGKVVMSTSVRRVGGMVRFVNELADAPPPPVPASITPLQARKALRVAGFKAAVDAYVATLPVEQQEEWEYARDIYRDNPIIAAGITAGIMTEAQVDDLFRLGATL